MGLIERLRVLPGIQGCHTSLQIPIRYTDKKIHINIQGGTGCLTHGWFGFDIDVPQFFSRYAANAAIFPSAQAELGRQWNELNKYQPNPGVRPPCRC